MTALDDILSRLKTMGEDDRKGIAAEVMAATKALKWIPSPGPQAAAYFSEADVLLFGGEPGGGKSQLILGLAFNCHERSLIMRRQYGDLERLIEDALKIHGSRDGFNGSPPPRLRISERKVINFRAAQHIGDEQGTMGQGRDLLGIDEATHFAESQIRFLMGWVRTETVGQRCRTVLATNPPLTAEGAWVNKMFAPWLDDAFPNPAKHGELRWVISGDDGYDEWVDGPDDVREVSGRTLRPTSRTFIPSSVDDNPYYAATDYKRQLEGLPEEIRSKLLGGFKTVFKDDDYQVIPSAWIEEAQRRWTKNPPADQAMTAMAVDVAPGGGDQRVICWRYGGWFGPLQAEKVVDKTGNLTAAEVVRHRRDNCPVVVDLGGGWGGDATIALKDNGIPVLPFNGVEPSSGRTRDGKLKFGNRRAEAVWKFREELDPSQQGGSVIALPPDAELRADLAAYRFKHEGRGLMIEPKEKIRDRIGRSPDKGDAVIMCLSEGNRAVMRAWRSRQYPGGELPTRANIGFANVKQRYR